MNDYPYPPDEFDEVPSGAQSAGIHRVRRSAWSRTWPYLAVLVIFALVAYGFVTWFSSRGPDRSDDKPTATATAPQETTAEAPTETTPPAPETTTEPPATETTEPGTTEPETTEPEETTEPAAALDRSLRVRVLNATSTQGLAASGVSRLKDAGFTDVSGANYTGSAVSASQVWFQGPQYADEAAEIASVLGISAVQQVDSLSGPVSVILSSDFSGR